MYDYKKKGHKSHWKLYALLVAIVLLGIVLAVLLLWTPGAAPPTVGTGDFLLVAKGGGTVEVSWPASPNAMAYQLSLRTGEEASFTQLMAQYTTNSARLTLDLSQSVDLKVQPVSFGRNLFGMTRQLASEESMQITIAPHTVDTPEVVCTPSQDKSVELSWEPCGNHYEIYAVNSASEYIFLTEVDDSCTTIQFGAGGMLDMPTYARPAQLAVRAAYRGDGYVLYGFYSATVSVDRDDLLGNQLNLTYEETGDRVYTFYWNETKGDYYEIQEWIEAYAHWEPLARIERTEELTYQTERLASGSKHRYRIAAYSSEAGESYGVTESNGFSADPSEIRFQASVSPLYCTVWPIVNVALCGDTQLDDPLGEIPAGTALCVLEENGDCFYVRYNGQYGYVDSRYCMINLTEYLGEWCTYDITNSYQSIFKVHGYPLINITSRVVPGFEHVQTVEGTFLVPYLYPSAQKLLTAAQAAQMDGYRLKIYEAFRPNEATRFLYDTASAQLDRAVPLLGEDGNYTDAWTGLLFDGITGWMIDPDTGEQVNPLEVLRYTPEVPEEETGISEEEGKTEAGEEEAELPEDETEIAPEAEAEAENAPEDEMETTPEDGVETMPEDGVEDSVEMSEEQVISEDLVPLAAAPTETQTTYREAMTNGQYKIGSFLAAVVSAHNRGIALDLTLEQLDDGKEMSMQSEMHDLSWHSVTDANNSYAKQLEKYMTDVGMVGLFSEWWHYQDDDTKDALGLTSYLKSGVSAEGWVKDDVGWRYRNADGSYSRESSLTVNGVKYRLDKNGYVEES